MITPEEIDKKEFTTVRIRAGYDPDEVDLYLDQVAVEYRAVLAQLAASEVDRKLIAQRSEATTQQLPTVYANVDKLLSVAQRAADEIVAEANGKAGDIIAKADKQANDALNVAVDRADEIIKSGQDQRHATIGKLEVQRVELENTVASLKDEQAVLRTRMADALSALGES